MLMSWHFAERPLVRASSFVVVPMTALSRVYFAVHYIHDVVAGAALGVLLFRLKDYFLVYDERGARNRWHQVVRWAVVAMGFVVSELLFEQVHRARQLGIYFSIGALVASSLLEPRLSLFEDHSTTSWKLFARFFIGILPVLISGALTYHLRLVLVDQLQRLMDLYLFTLGVFVISWMYFASYLFDYLGLGHLSTMTLREAWAKHKQA
jgi:hypothetical protein